MGFLHQSLCFLAFLILYLPLSLAKDPKISIQWAICDTDAATVLQKLGYTDEQPYKANPIVYYDTWPPRYTRNGIAFRTKVKKHDPGYPISMIKARFGDYNENVPSEADCVWDRYGNDTTYTCGLMSVLAEVSDGTQGETIWSQEQRDFAARYQDVDWKSLVPFGPHMNPKWKIHILGMKAVFDDVQALPLHLMEIEVTARKAESEEVYDRVDRFLRAKGVVLCEKQLPKTLRLFEFLEKQVGLGMGGSGSGQIVVGQ